jgi:DNA end-binding protein Ku
MPARSIGSGTVSFGLVSIPVKMYSASDSGNAVSFNMLHGKCRSRLKQQYICPKDSEVVPREDMVKGYEFSRDQYVIFTDEELKSLSRESTRAIEIAEFVPADKVDPVFFEGAYYLGPDKGGERAYKLLAEAMRQTGRAALARWVARGKQYLVLLRPIEGGIVMQQLHYADEIRAIAEVPVGDADVREAELKLALQLIEQVASDEFHPERYEDEVKKQLHEAIQKKVEGQDVVAAPEPPKGQIIDLMEALKASVAARAEASKPAGAATTEAGTAERKPARSTGRNLRVVEDEDKRGGEKTASGGRKG